MAKCQLAKKDAKAAGPYLKRAREIYPKEAQAHFLTGYVQLEAKKYNQAIESFKTYDELLAGNPNILFFKGFSYEGLKKKKPAAEHYHKYLQAVNQGDNAKHAYKRLVEWGYIKKK
jgi:tetratricopeptide (TPR) repeat protein